MEDSFTKSRVSFVVLLKKLWVYDIVAIIEGGRTHLSNELSWELPKNSDAFDFN